jgi:hypothetical protein
VKIKIALGGILCHLVQEDLGAQIEVNAKDLNNIVQTKEILFSIY